MAGPPFFLFFSSFLVLRFVKEHILCVGRTELEAYCQFRLLSSPTRLSLSHTVYMWFNWKLLASLRRRVHSRMNFQRFSRTPLCVIFFFFLSLECQNALWQEQHTHTHARFLYYNGTLYHLKIPPCSYPGDFIVYITRTEKRKREREDGYIFYIQWPTADCYYILTICIYI